MENSSLSTCSCVDEPQVLDELEKMSYVHIVFASLSIIGASSVIIFATFKRSFQTDEVQPLFQLSAADLCLAMCWVVGASFFLKHSGGSYNPCRQMCFYLQVLTEIFHLITFFLTTNYALNVYMRIIDAENRRRSSHTTTSANMQRGLTAFSCCSWLLPILVMTPIIVYHLVLTSTSDEPCFLCLVVFERPSAKNINNAKWGWKNYGTWAFVIALIISIIAMLVLYLLSYQVYRQLNKQSVWTDVQREAVANMRIRVTLYILVFLFCWTPALALAIIELITFSSNGDNNNEYFKQYNALYYIQGFTAPSQGFLNSIVYGWTRAKFREARSPLLANSGDQAVSEASTMMEPRTIIRTYGSLAAGRIFVRTTSPPHSQNKPPLAVPDSPTSKENI